jgi:hypothetical protein
VSLVKNDSPLMLNLRQYSDLVVDIVAVAVAGIGAAGAAAAVETDCAEDDAVATIHRVSDDVVGFVVDCN